MTALLELWPILFPRFQGVNCNMLPIIIGDPGSVPEEYAQYCDMMNLCDIEPEENGRVGYLSIAEFQVRAGASQRRPGIHTEAVNDGGVGYGWGWGAGGMLPGRRKQGLYLASTVDASCQAWNQEVEPGTTRDGREDLRQILDQSPSCIMKASTLYWMTDKCPHEALPQQNAGPRQWFRLVTSPVSVWFQDHSTVNPLVSPAARVITGDKFQ